MRWYVALALMLVVPALASAQTEPGPPGPYVIDLRGAMIGVPNAGEFYPTLPTGATIPGRAFGGDVGGHVLLNRIGQSRLGVGVNVVAMRGRVGPPNVSATIVAVAPQVSLNFGTADGWSFLSAGYGGGRLSTRTDPSAVTADDEEDEPVTADTTAETGRVGALNFGGGARWFVNSHAAVGFDVRFYRFAASSENGTPATMRVALSVGVSLR